MPLNFNPYFFSMSKARLIKDKSFLLFPREEDPKIWLEQMKPFKHNFARKIEQQLTIIQRVEMKLTKRLLL